MSTTMKFPDNSLYRSLTAKIGLATRQSPRNCASTAPSAPLLRTNDNSSNSSNNITHRYRGNPEKDEDKKYNANMYPTAAGQQLDLNHLWQQVQELSAVLAANRESTIGLVKKADEIRNRGGGDPTALDAAGLVDGAAALPSARELELTDENKALKQEIAELRAENEDLGLLAQDYETVLEKVQEGLRIYAHDHSIATINIHSSYTNQLANERAQNAALRQKEIENQARLANLSRMLREAYQQETVLEPDIVIERLKAENEALRLALGVEGDCGEE